MQQLKKRNLRVLLCEDDIVSSQALAKQLKDRGIDIVSHLQKTTDALEQISQLRFDLIILDVWLRDEKKGGVVIARHLRETSDIPIIFQTGYSDEVILHELSSISNAQIIQKPYEIEDLLALVDSVPI